MLCNLLQTGAVTTALRSLFQFPVKNLQYPENSLWHHLRLFPLYLFYYHLLLGRKKTTTTFFLPSFRELQRTIKPPLIFLFPHAEYPQPPQLLLVRLTLQAFISALVLLPHYCLCKGGVQPVAQQGGAMTQEQDLSLRLVELQTTGLSPSIWPIQSLLQSPLPFRTSPLTTSIVSSANCLRLHSNSYLGSLIKMLNRTSPNTEP